MKKILHVLAVKPVGGVGTFLKNTYEKGFDSEYDFDIIESGNEVGGNFDEYFVERGSEIYLLPEIKKYNIYKYFRECKRFYLENNFKYDAIHVHSTAVAYFHLYFAKKYGINNRIFHAHLDIDRSSLLKRIRDDFFIHMIKKYSTSFCACGHKAGKSIFGEQKYEFIPNGINVNKFGFNSEIRKKIRSDISISEELLIGIVGRIDEVKNPMYVLKIAKKLLGNDEIKFIFFGNGNLLDECKEIAESNNLNNVIFMGNVSNISDYYNAMDLLLLPSRKEGFSLVAIEGQCNGLPIVFSDTLDRSMKILEESTFIKTDEDHISEWEKYLLNFDRNSIDRTMCMDIVARTNSVEISRKKLKDFYNKVLK